MNSNNESESIQHSHQEYLGANPITAAAPATGNATTTSSVSPNPTRVGWPSPSRQLAGLYTEGRVVNYRENGAESNQTSNHTSNPHSSHSHSPFLNHHRHSSASTSSLSHNHSSAAYSAPSPRTYPPFSSSTPRTQPTSSSYYSNSTSRERTSSHSHSLPSHHRSYSHQQNSNVNDDHHWSSSISNHTQVGLPPPPSIASSSSNQHHSPPPPDNAVESPSNSATTTTNANSRKRNAKNQDVEDGNNGNGKGKKTKRKRASMACTRCRGQKLRCDGTRPCARCTSLNKQDMCIYETPAQEKHAQAMASNSATAQTSNQTQPPPTTTATAPSTSAPMIPPATTSNAYVSFSPAPTPLPSERRGSLIVSSPRDDRGIWNPLPSNSNHSFPYSQPQPLPNFNGPQSNTNNNNNAIHSITATPSYVSELNSRMARIEGLLENFISNNSNKISSNENGNGFSSSINTSSRGRELHRNIQGQPPGTPGTASSARASSRVSGSGTNAFLPPFSEVVFNPKVFENRELTRSNTPEEEVSRGRGNNERELQDKAISTKDHDKDSSSHQDFSSKNKDGQTNGEKEKSNGSGNEVRFEDDGKENENDGSGKDNTVKAGKNVVSVLGLGGAESAKDPIAHGVVTEERAQEFVDLFVEKCLPFIPILDMASTSALKVSSLRQSGPFLITTILAIASRYRPDSTNSTSTPNITSAPPSPRLSSSKVPGQLSATSALSVEHAALVLLAETHLGQSLSRKRHSLGDVQATLFLAAFGLRPGGAGCDSWIVTGHAFRLARRLSFDTAVCGEVRSGLSASPAMRRTWLMLCAFDCFPSLGFGRPLSSRRNLDACSKTVKEIKETSQFKSSLVEGGSGNNLDPTSSRAKQSDQADAFVCAQVDLALISRKLLDWVAQATEQQARAEESLSSSGAGISPEIIWTNWRNIVEELDSWERTYDSLLSKVNSIQRIGASLYHSHVRLCLASFALRLSEVVNEELRQARREARLERGEGAEEDASFKEDDEFQTAYRTSGRNAASEMVRIHLFVLESDQTDATSRSLEIPSGPISPSPLAFTPDYLLVALAQSAIAYTRLYSSSSSGNDSTIDHSKLKEKTQVSEQDFKDNLNPILLLKASEKVLAFLDSPRTGIAIFLRSKIKDALLAFEEQQENGVFEIENIGVSISRLASRRSSRSGVGLLGGSNEYSTGLTPYNDHQWSGGLLTDSLHSTETSIRAAHNAALPHLNQNDGALENWELEEMPNSNGWSEAVNWDKDIVSMLFGQGQGQGQGSGPGVEGGVA